MKRARTGRDEALLPRDFDGTFVKLLESAAFAIGRLDSVSTFLPDASLLLGSYIRKEAVLSCQIDGVRSSLADLLLFEIGETPDVPRDDVSEVSKCVAALEHGLERVRSSSRMTNRILGEMQNMLSRDEAATPQRFIYDRDVELSVLVRAGMAHAEVNGRVGRLLITLLLCDAGVLREPLLYLSLYLKERRSTYYTLLDSVRREGDWERWLAFFIDGVRQAADNAVTTAERLGRMFHEDRELLIGVGRRAGSALRVHDALKARPLASVQDVAARSGLSFPAAASAMELLAELEIVSERTGRRRNRIFAYDQYLAILSEGTENPPRA